MKITVKLWLFSVVLILFNLLWFWLKPGGDNLLTIVSDLLPIICVVIAIWGMFAAVRSFKTLDQIKVAWILLFCGIVLFSAGEFTYALLEIILKVDMNEVFPTIADLFWFAGYLPLIVGLSMLVYGYKKSGFSFGKKTKYIFGLCTLALITGLLIYRLFIPILKDTETGNLAKFAYLYYPIADLFLIIPSIILAYITNLFGDSHISRPWRYISIGFLCMTVSDVLYSYLSWNNMYGPGNPIDIAWNLGYLLIGLAGLYQKDLIESV